MKKSYKKLYFTLLRQLESIFERIYQLNKLSDRLFKLYKLLSSDLGLISQNLHHFNDQAFFIWGDFSCGVEQVIFVEMQQIMALIVLVAWEQDFGVDPPLFLQNL